MLHGGDLEAGERGLRVGEEVEEKRPYEEPCERRSARVASVSRVSTRCAYRTSEIASSWDLV